MNAALFLIIGCAVLVVGYIFYGGWLAKKWGVDNSRPTPAHTMEDGKDYCPAKAPVLMGHHFSSIAGAGPINGPIQAAVFGWVPVMLWVLIGGIFFGGSLIKLTNSEVPSIALSNTSLFFKTTLPGAGSTGWFGQLFLSYGFLAYVAIIIALGASYFLNHTRPGLHLRAVGESASTADAAGINVTKYKYLATCIGSMIAGLGGLYYVMDYANGVWSNNAFGDRGWLAIALVIFTIWRPNVSILASILFGGLYIINIYLPTPGGQMAVKELYKMLPYVITLLVLIVVSLRKKREDQPPASLGLSYFREER